METFLMLNGSEISCPTDEQEQVMLDLAAGRLDRDGFTNWIKRHTTKRSS